MKWKMQWKRGLHDNYHFDGPSFIIYLGRGTCVVFVRVWGVRGLGYFRHVNLILVVLARGVWGHRALGECVQVS